MKAVFSAAAKRDAQAAVDWYIDRSAGEAAEAFLDDIDRAVELVLRHPRIGTPGVAATRSLRLQSFPYSLVYRVVGDVVRVIAISAHRRRPGYWIRRD
jgi:toxin ParE1/3/4